MEKVSIRRATNQYVAFITGSLGSILDAVLSMTVGGELLNDVAER